jgi:MazG family protein
MQQPTGSTLPRLVQIMERLLAPDGCPWDREQTLESLRPFLIEECFELVEALDEGNPALHREELGDVLFQLVFQAALREQSGDFSIDDVITAISNKLERRHPHVFADASVEDSDEVVTRWEEIKAEEKAEKGEARKSLVDGIPVALPALTRAQKISSRVARVGFDWPDADRCLDKVEEEAAELRQALRSGAQEQIEEELGDLLFATVSLARKTGVDAETALRAANRKFCNRFKKVEDSLAARGKTPKESSLEEMDQLWEESKQAGA